MLFPFLSYREWKIEYREIERGIFLNFEKVSG